MASLTQIAASKYHRGRKKLIEQMGGRCTYCQATEKLEFHHLTTRTWVARKTARWVRLARYRREWMAGQCVLACPKCNKKKGAPDEEPLGD